MKLNIEQFGYNDNVLFCNTSLTFSFSDKISLTGSNGVGKSTLLDLLCNKITNNTLRDCSFTFGYYGPHTTLPLDITMSQILWQFSDFLDKELQYKLLRGFDFENHLNTRIGALSRGNNVKSKLIFLLSLKRRRFLLLDEPTENLDKESIDFLAKYLKGLNSGHLVASHNKSFLSQTCKRHISIINKKIIENAL